MNFLTGLILAIVLNPHPQTAAQRSCGETKLPLSARRALISHFPGWKIVTEEDLIPEDRRLWTDAHGASCPGVIRGHFEGGKLSYAAALIKKNKMRLLQTLVVLTNTGNNYVVRTLDPPSTVARPLVITKLPPGAYDSANRHKQILAKFDVIQEEAIEAGATIFYWENGSYNNLIVSE